MVIDLLPFYGLVAPFRERDERPPRGEREFRGEGESRGEREREFRGERREGGFRDRRDAQESRELRGTARAKTRAPSLAPFFVLDSLLCMTSYRMSVY